MDDGDWFWASYLDRWLVFHWFSCPSFGTSYQSSLVLAPYLLASLCLLVPAMSALVGSGIQPSWFPFLACLVPRSVPVISLDRSWHRWSSSLFLVDFAVSSSPCGFRVAAGLVPLAWCGTLPSCGVCVRLLEGSWFRPVLSLVALAFLTRACFWLWYSVCWYSIWRRHLSFG